MRMWGLAQVMLWISAACFVASFIVQGFSAEHPLILTFTRVSALSFVLGIVAGGLSILAHRLFGPRQPAMVTSRR
ncbi:MAG: hypothetical protein PGN09_04415 [Sphingomonas fennica]